MDELNVEAVQAEAKRNEEMSKRRLAEMEKMSTIESAKAIHAYNLATEHCQRISIDLQAAIVELEIVQREEEHVQEEYKKAKREFKEFPTSNQLKTAYKVAKKKYMEVDDRFQKSTDTVQAHKHQLKVAKEHQKKALRDKKKFEAGGSGIEKDWRLR